MPPDAATSMQSARSERTPPYSEEAEKGVLGSIFLDAARVMDLAIENQLQPESFFTPAHRIIYGVMLDMLTDGVPIDVLTVGERLKTQGRLESVGGAQALDRLIDSTPTAAHADFYIDLVRQKHLLRSIIHTAQEAERECHGSEENADVVLGRLEQAFLDITERQHGHMTPWTETVKSTMGHIEKSLENRLGISGLPTGLRNIDTRLAGLRAAELIILAARPGTGKTSLAMNIAENIAMGRVIDHQRRPIGIFSLEMSAESLAMRMLCTYAEVSSFKVTTGSIGMGDEHKRLINAAGLLSKAPIYLDDTAGLDVLELRARARRMKKKFGVELIIVDYLQLLHSKEYAKQGRQLETANISNNLKAMAKELKVPVLALSQLSRAPDQRSEKGPPRLSDLRDSGAIEQDADVVLMLYRPFLNPGAEGAEDRKLVTVVVAKNRNGPVGETELNFDEEYTRFVDRYHGVDNLEPEPAPAAHAETVVDPI